MSPLNIKPTHKPIKNYYAELKAYETIGAQHEGAVRTAFQNLLQHYCRQADLILVCEKTRYTKENRRIQLDGEVVDAFDLPHGHWEAKDTHDDLPTEAKKKSEAGYPFKNIIIQSPTRALLYQNKHLRIFRCHITNKIPDYKFSNSSNGGTQCFPFYTYDDVRGHPA